MNVSNCSVLTVNQKQNPMLSIISLTMSSWEDQNVLIVDQQLIFDYYISKTVSSVMRMLGIIIRNLNLKKLKLSKQCIIHW